MVDSGICTLGGEGGNPQGSAKSFWQPNPESPIDYFLSTCHVTFENLQAGMIASYVQTSSEFHSSFTCNQFATCLNHKLSISCLSYSSFHNLDLSIYLQFSHPLSCSYFSSRSSPSPCPSKRCDFSWFRRHISRHVVAICEGVRCSGERSLSIISTWLWRNWIPNGKSIQKGINTMMESRISFKHDTDSQVLMYCLGSEGCPLDCPVKLVGFQ